MGGLSLPLKVLLLRLLGAFAGDGGQHNRRGLGGLIGVLALGQRQHHLLRLRPLLSVQPAQPVQNLGDGARLGNTDCPGHRRLPDLGPGAELARLMQQPGRLPLRQPTSGRQPRGGGRAGVAQRLRGGVGQPQQRHRQRIQPGRQPVRPLGRRQPIAAPHPGHVELIEAGLDLVQQRSRGGHETSQSAAPDTQASLKRSKTPSEPKQDLRKSNRRANCDDPSGGQPWWRVAGGLVARRLRGWWRGCGAKVAGSWRDCGGSVVPGSPFLWARVGCGAGAAVASASAGLVLRRE